MSCVQVIVGSNVFGSIDVPAISSKKGNSQKIVQLSTTNGIYNFIIRSGNLVVGPHQYFINGIATGTGVTNYRVTKGSSNVKLTETVGTALLAIIHHKTNNYTISQSSSTLYALAFAQTAATFRGKQNALKGVLPKSIASQIAQQNAKRK